MIYLYSHLQVELCGLSLRTYFYPNFFLISRLFNSLRRNALSPTFHLQLLVLFPQLFSVKNVCNTGATIIDSASTTSVSLFDTIASGTVSLFSNFSGSIASMFNSSTNNSTLEINAKVKFRQVKLYNQVKTITATTTLTFPLEEQIVIRPTATT